MLAPRQRLVRVQHRLVGHGLDDSWSGVWAGRDLGAGVDFRV